jgi:osmotically-inducible protein OsmY
MPREDFRDLEGERLRRVRREGPSDRVLWAVIMERLDDERRLDLRDVEVEVLDGEVTLIGTVRHRGHWTFI